MILYIIIFWSKHNDVCSKKNCYDFRVNVVLYSLFIVNLLNLVFIYMTLQYQYDLWENIIFILFAVIMFCLNVKIIKNVLMKIKL